MTNDDSKDGGVLVCLGLLWTGALQIPTVMEAGKCKIKASVDLVQLAFWFTLSIYSGQEATVRLRRGTTDWFQIGKGVHQGFIFSHCLFNFYAEYIMQSTRWNQDCQEK